MQLYKGHILSQPKDHETKFNVTQYFCIFLLFHIITLYRTLFGISGSFAPPMLQGMQKSLQVGHWLRELMQHDYSAGARG